MYVTISLLTYICKPVFPYCYWTFFRGGRRSLFKVFSVRLSLTMGTTNEETEQNHNEKRDCVHPVALTQITHTHHHITHTHTYTHTHKHTQMIFHILNRSPRPYGICV